MVDPWEHIKGQLEKRTFRIKDQPFRLDHVKVVTFVDNVTVITVTVNGDFEDEFTSHLIVSRRIREAVSRFIFNYYNVLVVLDVVYNDIINYDWSFFREPPI